jgi:hypothetical protein
VREGNDGAPPRGAALGHVHRERGTRRAELATAGDREHKAAPQRGIHQVVWVHH